MISIDLSKTPSLRFLIYLLALFPGLFFLLSIAVGDPQLAKTTIEQVDQVHPFPSYGLLLILVGSGFVIGEAFVLLSWLVVTVLTAIYRALSAAFRKLFGGARINMWFAKVQGIPLNKNLAVRILGRLIFLARGGQTDSEDAQAIRFCLAAATEKLLERRYGIDKFRATGPNGGEWQVWFTVMGKPVKSLVESLNAGRTTLACGLAGFLSLCIAPRLANRYYVAMSSLFVFSGLWAAGWYFILTRNPVWFDTLRLRSVLAELQDCSPPTQKPETTKTGAD